MTVLADFALSLWYLARGLVDAILGRRHRRYVSKTLIRAPRDIVWSAVTASEIVFDGLVPIELSVSPGGGAGNMYSGSVRIGDEAMPFTYREVERRTPDAVLVEILKEGSDPRLALGSDYYVACALEDRADATEMTTVHELTHDTFMGRVYVPLGARQNGRRIRGYCEAAVGAPPRETNKFGAAIVTGVLTYASFSYLFDATFAAYLLLILLIHEAGHALAMRWVGLPVQGIYFIPFLGGVAVAAARHRSEAERGFVALMGPGVSLVATGLFVLAAWWTDEQAFRFLALISAMLNGLNLAPVLPLDGGHVLDSALSDLDPEFVAIVNVLALFAGAGVALYLEWYVLLAILILISPAMIRSGRKGRGTEPITPAARNWLISGYLATVAFYVAVGAHFLR